MEIFIVVSIESRFLSVLQKDTLKYLDNLVLVNLHVLICPISQ
jgi:hypothetical protein